MSSNQVLSCNRCSNVAEVYIPENARVLCDDHFSVFKEAYSSVKFSTVAINDDNIEAITELMPKEATQVSELSTEVEEMHRVPVQLIVDHLGELLTGVEPATCKVCHKPMQLHSQFATTKQKDMESPKKAQTIEKSAGLSERELREAARPGFLANFADGGRGVCIGCNGTGLRSFSKPSSKKEIYKHLNDDRPGSGHYSQLMDYTSRIKDLNLDTAIKGNLPFYITKLRNIDANPHFDPNFLSEFPFSLAGYEQVDFTGNPDDDNPDRMLHAFLHAIGEYSPTMTTNHGHAKVDSLQELYDLSKLTEEEAREKMESPFCATCFGHGEHPLRRHPDFDAYLEEMAARASETPRELTRRKKPSKSDPFADAGVVDLSQLGQREAHAGPNIKPHDHHNKPHTYHKHQTGPGDSGAGSSQVRKKKKKSPSSGGGGGRGGGGRGRGTPFGLVKPKQNFFQKFPLEKWIYEGMNAVHDMTHTVYENPSYMYRNPNPMYYSVPRRQWGMSKPWRN